VTSFIGSQSSTGAGNVKNTDPSWSYWGPKINKAKYYTPCVPAGVRQSPGGGGMAGLFGGDIGDPQNGDPQEETNTLISQEYLVGGGGVTSSITLRRSTPPFMWSETRRENSVVSTCGGIF
jgi:hypothetical protein